MGIVIAVKALKLEYFDAFAQITGIVDSSLSLAVVTDVLIAGSLAYYLHTSRSGIKRTDKLVNQLLAYTINNGILTSAFDIVTLVFVTTEVNNLIFLAVFQVVGNLYTNSMMATLNSRKPHVATTTIDEVHFSSIRVAGGSHASSAMYTGHSHQQTNTRMDHIEDSSSRINFGEPRDIEQGKRGLIAD